MNYTYYIDTLRQLPDPTYKNYDSMTCKSSLPTLGVRVSEIRKLAKTIVNNGDGREFVSSAEMDSFDEEILISIVTATIKYDNYNELIKYFDKFLPKIESWFVCDTLCNSFSSIRKYSDKFIGRLEILVQSDDGWFKRIAFTMLMIHYIEEKYLPTIFEFTTKYDDQEQYYVSTAVATLLTTVCSKYPQQCVDYLNKKELGEKTHRRTIERLKKSYKIRNRKALLDSIE